MKTLNKVMLIGRLGKDPEVRYFESGSVKASFPLATNETYKDKSGNKVENTDWHNIVMWRGLAQVTEKYLKKGDLVYIEGKLKTRSWDGEDGNKKYITEVEASDMNMLGSRGDGGNSGGSSGYQQPNVSNPTQVKEVTPATDNLPEDDDLPF